MRQRSGSLSGQTCRQQPSRFRLIRRASGPEWKLAGRALLTTAWRKAKCCLGDEAVEKNLFVLLPRQQAVDWWGGRVGDLRGGRGRREEEEGGRGWWGEVLRRKRGGLTSHGRCCWRHSRNLSPCFIIHSISALFTPAGSQLRGRIYSFL